MDVFNKSVLKELRNIRDELHAISENTNKRDMRVDGSELKNAFENHEKNFEFQYSESGRGLMLEYYENIGTGEVIQAVKFNCNHLDKFFNYFGDYTEKIVFELSAKEKTVTITYPFNEHDDIKAHSGDYLIKGEEIPRSLPHRYHYDVMDGQEFCKKFKPLAVKEQLSNS